MWRSKYAHTAIKMSSGKILTVLFVTCQVTVLVKMSHFFIQNESFLLFISILFIEQNELILFVGPSIIILLRYPC